MANEYFTQMMAEERPGVMWRLLYKLSQTVTEDLQVTTHTLPQLVAVLRHFSFFSHFRLTSRKAFLGRKYEKEITQKHFSHFLILYKCITV